MLPYYRILGVARTAEKAEIKAAYRRLARKFHPDLHGGHELAETRFRMLAEAWEVLGDESNRDTFDKYGSQALTPRGRRAGSGVLGNVQRFVSNLESIVESRLAAVPHRGQDRRRIVQIRLSQACLGARLEIEVPNIGRCGSCHGSGAGDGSARERCHVCEGKGTLTRGAVITATDDCPFCQGRRVVALEPCEDCAGAGEVTGTHGIAVDIPPGVQRGRRLVLRGRGEPGHNGGEAGDLYLELELVEHALLTREGFDLRCVVPIRLSEALVGSTIRVPVLDGEPARIRVPAGAQSGMTLRLRDRGAPKPGGGQGDLLVTVQVETPALPDPAAVELLDRLEAAGTFRMRDAYESELDKA